MSKKNISSLLILVIGVLFLSACSNQLTESTAINPETYWGENPWPEIRKERISQLLPNAMKASGVDCWMVVCRENNNDPIADHVGGENAGGTAAFMFYIDAEGFHSRVYSPSGEATALDDLDIHDEVIGARGSSVSMAVDFIKESGFKSVAINSSTSNSMADGLSYTQRQSIERLMGKDSDKLVSSTELIYEWLSIKLPQEVEIMKKAAQLTSDWQIEAYKQVVPGKSTDAEIAKFLKQKITEYGLVWHLVPLTVFFFNTLYNFFMCKSKNMMIIFFIINIYYIVCKNQGSFPC